MADGKQGLFLVAATSLSDIVWGFYVAGCCAETTSDPASASSRFGPSPVALAGVVIEK